MATYRFATSQEARNPVRVQQWAATLRAGDDFKLALTVYADDTGAAAVVDGARGRLTLWRDQPTRHGWDYGLGWLTNAPPPGPAWLVEKVDGFLTPVRPGGINFALPGTITSSLCGRYRFAVQVDLAGGECSQTEGILQVRAGWTRPSLDHQPKLFFSSILTRDPPLALVGGLPVDADGFFYFAADFAPPPSAPDFPIPEGFWNNGGVLMHLTGAPTDALAEIGPFGALPTAPPAGGGFWNNGGVVCIGPLPPIINDGPPVVQPAPGGGYWLNGEVVCVA